jgi:MoaA/NifB/PqqE/SkfB family radical SAM enzyme
MDNLNGLAFINVELTSRCNKGDGTPGSGCWMCGRRKMEREHPEKCNWGDMEFDTLRRIALQVPRGIVIQFHSNGEPLLYPWLAQALNMFPRNIRCLNTNGKLLVERADAIIGNLETLTISVIEADLEGDEQYETVTNFITRLGKEKPTIIYRLLGDVHNRRKWEALPGKIATRILHSPEGSREYQKKVTIPEIGICLDLLSHLAIDRYGNISMCVRFDPEGHLRLGNINHTSLLEAWYGEKRKEYIEHHIAGRRGELPGCDRCEFYGVPTSPCDKCGA